MMNCEISVSGLPDLPSFIASEPLEGTLDRLCAEIHADNVAAGWWSDLATGDSIIATRNRGETMMLIVSELSEACEGAAQRLKDDKLPDLPMFDVELADAAIRLLDLLGAEHANSGVNGYTLNLARSEMDHLGTDAALMGIVNSISRAMEAHRKNRLPDYLVALQDALAMIFALAGLRGIDLLTVIARKRAYNATRADHKVENRRRAGGKAY